MERPYTSTYYKDWHQYLKDYRATGIPDGSMDMQVTEYGDGLRWLWMHNIIQTWQWFLFDDED